MSIVRLAASLAEVAYYTVRGWPCPLCRQRLRVVVGAYHVHLAEAHGWDAR